MANDILVDKKMPAGELFKRTMKYVKEEFHVILISLLLIVVTVAINVLVPRISGFYVDYIEILI